MAALTKWNIEYNGLVKTLKDWGVSEATGEFRNQASDSLVLVCAGQRYDAEPTFAYGGQIILRDPNGRIFFQGLRIVPDREGSSRHQGVTYHFAGPWEYLEKTPFGQPWKIFTSAGVSTYQNNSHIMVPGKLDANNQFTKLTNGGQIRAVIEFCLAQNPGTMQIGTISPALDLLLDEKKDLRCSQVIQLMLGLCPDARCYFDHSTRPPTFHCIQRPQMTPVTIALSDERIESLRLRDRDDFKPTCVAIYYERVNSVDGQPRNENIAPDIYPPNANPFGFGSLLQTVQLQGATINHVTQLLITTPVPDTPDAQWFIDRGLSVADGATIEAFEYLGRAGLAHEIIEGQVHQWMEGITFLDTVLGAYRYTVTGQKTDFHDAKVQINTTNLDATGGRWFSRTASVVFGEDPIPNLAQTIYNSMAEPGAEGPIVLHEFQVQGDIGLNNTINISGGSNRYQNLNALTQSIGFDLKHGITTIHIGPPAHLTIEQILDLQRFNRSRAVYTDPTLQATGAPGSSEIALSGLGPMRNTTAAIRQVQDITVGTQPSRGTRTTSDGIVIDASNVAALEQRIQILESAIAAIKNDAKVKFREYEVSERQPDGSCKTRYVILLGSEIYDK